MKTQTQIPQQRTKIVATVGPASDTAAVFGAMVDAGLDVARINFSHGTHESNGAAMRMIRAVACEKAANVAILADLQGPRVRTVVARTFALTDGMPVRVVGVAHGEEAPAARDGMPVIGLDQPAVIDALRIGHRIFIEDGLRQLIVHDIAADGAVTALVHTGGDIVARKGVNLPDTDVPLPALTTKDEEDLAFLLTQDVDYIALSFVRRAQDIVQLRARIAAAVREPDARPRIVAKVERPEALAQIDAIAAAADAVMVARGDLATETGQEGVVIAQKRIIAAAARHATPVIVATQMLASMEHAPRPTRAEIADVTNAVIDHTDAVMLSGETATGVDPAAAVATMDGIIRATERSPYDDVTTPPAGDGEAAQRARAAWQHAHSVGADAIVIATMDDVSVRAIAHTRPSARVIVITASDHVRRRCALVWGAEAYYDERALTYDAHALIDRAQALTGARNIVVA